MTYPYAQREQRRAELMTQTKRTLILMHRNGSGCLMPTKELRGWTIEELVVAILDGEFGPLPSILEQPTE